jgi:MFS family permease
VHDGLTTLRTGLATRELRHLQTAWAATSLGNWAFYILLSIYAFETDGAAGVGLAAVVRMLPAGVAAPFTSLLADRGSRRDLLLWAALTRALTLALAAAAVLAAAPFAVVLVVAAVQTVAETAVKPAQSALLPLLARTPEQLGAANAVLNAVENVGFLVGALAGGLVAAGSGVGTGLTATAAALLLAAVALRGLPRDAPPPHREAQAGARLATDVLAGFSVVLRQRRLRLVVAALAVATVVEGAADVLLVVVAFDVLGIGEAGLGSMNAAWGVGGLLGGAAALALVRGGRLASALGGGCVVVGVALAGIAGWQAVVPALVLLVVVGVGYTLIEVAGVTLTQRLAGDDVIGRVFGVLESTYVFTTAIGSALAPVAIALLGVEGALLASGATMAAVALLAGRPLARSEASVPVPEREFALLRGLSIFAPLPLATVETLATRLRPVALAAGDVVVHEGDPGDRCYVVCTGGIELSTRKGWRTQLGAGGFFGEIALLRGSPRTATARAAGPALLLALERDDFLAAVTGHAPTHDAAEALVTERLRPHGS